MRIFSKAGRSSAAGLIRENGFLTYEEIAAKITARISGQEIAEQESARMQQI